MQTKLSLFFFSLLLLAGTHIFASKFSLYWQYPWFDIPMHLLGGITVALGVAILPFFNIHFFERSRQPHATLLAVLCVGIAWEIFEFSAIFSVYDTAYVLDTAGDLLMDICGGFIGYAIAQKIKS